MNSVLSIVVLASITAFVLPSPAKAAGDQGVKLQSAARLGSQWGIVTSAYRSVAHNKAVGGVPNSYHLSGSAIDIARRAGVTHAQIDAAFRRAGYRIVETIDEGDHSHFAFGGAAKPATSIVARGYRITRTNGRVHATFTARTRLASR